MQFEAVKASIIAILGAAAAGNFQVVGFQRQSKGAVEVEDNSRIVQVYYSAGRFQSQRRVTGPVNHDLTFRVEFTVSKAARANLSVLSDPSADTQDKADALAAMVEASDLADESLDEVFRHVYQILMDGRNYDLGLDKGDVANRWVTDFSKDEPSAQGELVVLTGQCNFECRVSEDIIGETPTEIAEPVFDTTVQQKDDPAKAGAQVGEDPV